MVFVYALALGAQISQVSLRDGTYEVSFYNPSTKKFEQQPKDLPPGQIRRGYIKGARFAILDFMVGFQGPIKKKGKTWEFILEEGPSGKVKGKPEIAIVTTSADKKVLSFKMKEIPMMEWTWKEAKIPFKLPY